MLDFIEKGIINTGKVQFVILDEADRMLDMGKTK
jgi:superfamily II DNA/RNA helicase